MAPLPGPDGDEVVGVCYLTATAAEADVADLRVRIEATTDVASGRSTTRYVIGPDAATDAVRAWMNEMCSSGDDATEGPGEQ